MEHTSESRPDRARGAVNAVTLVQLEKFVEKWLSGGGDCVQQWLVYEKKAADFFGIRIDDRAEFMHAFMQLVVGITRGTPSQVKEAVRASAPSVLELVLQKLNHLPQFTAVLQAEVHYRTGQLAGDWTLQCEGDQCIVRSEFRLPSEVH